MDIEPRSDAFHREAVKPKGRGDGETLAGSGCSFPTQEALSPSPLTLRFYRIGFAVVRRVVVSGVVILGL